MAIRFLVYPNIRLAGNGRVETIATVGASNAQIHALATALLDMPNIDRVSIVSDAISEEIDHDHSDNCAACRG